jgi:ATP-dependent protease ClpP protease subunit
MQHHIYIDGVIGISGGLFAEEGFTVKDLNTSLAAMPKGIEEIVVHINSPGGIMVEGFAIHDLLKARDEKVTTIIEGMCGSIATVVALAGDTRKMHKNSEFFVHPPLVTYIEKLNASEAQKLANELSDAQERLINFYCESLGKDRAIIEPLVMNDTTLNSDKALELGFVTEIITGKVQLETKHKIFNYITKNKIQMSNETNNKVVEAIESLAAKIENLFKPKIQNAMHAYTKEGVEVYWDGELVAGTKVFIDEGMTTPAPDGEHTIGETVIVVANGEITEVKAVAAAPAEPTANEKELQAKIDELTAQLEDMKKQKDKVANQVEAIKNEFASVRAQIITGKNEPNVGEGIDAKNEKIENKDIVAQMLELRNKRQSK